MSRALSEHQETHSRRSREPANQDALTPPRAREPTVSVHTNCSRQEVDKIATQRVKRSIDRRGPVPNKTNVPQSTHPSLSTLFVHTTTPFVASNSHITRIREEKWR